MIIHAVRMGSTLVETKETVTRQRDSLWMKKPSFICKIAVHVTEARCIVFTSISPRLKKGHFYILPSAHTGNFKLIAIHFY